jgi:hypothetical protein
MLVTWGKVDVEGMWCELGGQVESPIYNDHHVKHSGKRTPLQDACYNLSANVVRYLLLDCQVCLHSKTEAGNTPLEEVDRALNDIEFFLAHFLADEEYPFCPDEKAEKAKIIRLLLQEAEIKMDDALKFIKPSVDPELSNVEPQKPSADDQ